MSKPGPALGFYLKHGNDAAALAELDSPPAGVEEGDWTKFRTVVAMANEEVAELLRVCREVIETSLGDAIVPIGNGASHKGRAQNWDAWQEFRAPGRSKKSSLGWFGALLDVRDDETGWLIGYLRLKDPEAGVRLRDALKATAPTADQLAAFTPDTGIVFQVPVNLDIDLEGVTKACGQPFAAIRDGLKAYLTGPAGRH
jgi:hypothetical protein